MASEKQIAYIQSLTKRLQKGISETSPTFAHIQWGLTACKDMTTQEASEWIGHLRDLIRATNEVTARYSANGRGSQI